VGGSRRCPICDAVTDARLCAIDKVSTLLIDAPGVDVASVRVGQVIAERYVIERKIGKGGFGAVFAARHTGTGQEVAIKCLNTAAGVEDVTLRRFFQEARVTSALRHPNTIHVFDFGQDDTGLLFIAMELLSGRTLKEELSLRKKQNRVFTEDEAINVAIGALRSLSEAHAAGLVHRDLKPDNIFLHEVPGEEPIIKVLDFGIVKLGDSTITLGSDSGVPGTPAFMSPEQVTRQSVDGRSDLYSLGCVLYQLITGRVPLRGDSAMQTLYKHVHEAPEDVRSMARTPISEELATIIHRALAKDPKDRFDGAKTMRAALEVCRGGEPSSSLRPHMARGPTRLQRSSSPLPNDATVSERRASLFTGPGLDEVDASVPDISKQHLPRPPSRRTRAVFFSLVIAFSAAALVAAGAILSSNDRPIPGAPPAEIPRAAASEPPPEEPAPEEPAVEAAPAPIEDAPREPAPIKRRSPARKKKAPKKDAPPEAPAYDLLDEKI
jgi:serine/threonine protein kinase